MIQGIIFDLGNTLIHTQTKFEASNQIGTDAAADFLRASGIALPADFGARWLDQRRLGWKRADETHVEQTVEDALAATLAQIGVASRDGIVPRAVEAYFRAGDSGWVPYPEALATVQTLRARGLRVGLISNADDVGIVHRAVERFGFKPYLDPVWSSAEAPRWRKPDARIFLRVADAWGIAPAQIAYVGDTVRYDVVGAHRAGMRALLVDRGENFAWQKTPAELAQDAAAIPEATIASLNEIFDWMQKS